MWIPYRVLLSTLHRHASCMEESWSLAMGYVDLQFARNLQLKAALQDPTESISAYREER